jgi:hypothetical protein
LDHAEIDCFVDLIVREQIRVASFAQTPNAALTDTVVTRAIDGAPQRVIRSNLVDRLERRSGPAALSAQLLTGAPPAPHPHGPAPTWSARGWP